MWHRYKNETLKTDNIRATLSEYVNAGKVRGYNIEAKCIGFGKNNLDVSLGRNCDDDEKVTFKPIDNT
jgi:hypothetical protein